MKASLWWRLAIISALLVGWTYSMFPIKDRDFFATLQKLAAPQLAGFQSQKSKAEAAAAELQKKLDAIKDKESAAARALDTRRQAEVAKATTAGTEVAAFDLVLGNARKLMAANAKLAPYLAVKEAARGEIGKGRIQLRNYLPVPGQGRASNDLVLSYVRREAAGKFHLGLDLRGGTEFVIGFNAADIKDPSRTVESVRDQILEILRNRVDALGVAEPEIKPIGPSSISLRMPSVTENEKADIRRTIQQTAKLEFHIVHQDSTRLVPEYERSPRTFPVEPGYSYVQMETERDGQLEIEGLFIKTRPERVRGEDLAKAFATFNQFGSYSISIEFDARGAEAFREVTSENVKKRMAIVLDGKVYSAPVINEAIPGGRAEISGNFSAEEAQRLAVVLQCGRLPVSIAIDSEFGTDPTLGKDSIRAGALAGFWGTLAVVLFMLTYYRLSGVIAVLALVANLVLLIGTMTLTGATFTLPGIAGIILTIGMAVDANILIFERIREELAAGKTIGNAVHSGFSRAFVTILDSNLTTLITGLILFKFGSGSVKGFAITLSVGIVANIFTAVTFSRVIFDVMLHYGNLKTLKMMQLFKRPNFDFIKIRWFTYSLSAFITVSVLVTMVVRGKDSLSIDFSGGTAITYRYDAPKPPEVGAIRAAVEKGGYKDARIGYKSSGTLNEHLLEIVLATTGKSANAGTESVLALLQSSFPEAKFQQIQTYSVGGLVGADFQRKALIAVALSWVAIIIYVWLRFEFAYGVAGVVALIHDVLVAAGVLLLFHRQLSLPVLAALLTIIGYSINDTIVVFDRIRESISLQRPGSYADVVNLSINQTLSRTILTSTTVFFTVLALFLFGGGAINDFALCMMAGVITGTYSSVFIASAIIVSWHKRRPIVHGAPATANVGVAPAP